MSDTKPAALELLRHDTGNASGVSDHCRHCGLPLAELNFTPCTGKVAEPPAPPAGDVCPTCGGRGTASRRVDGKTYRLQCFDCKGTGKIAEPILVLGDGVTYNKERGAVEVWGGGGAEPPILTAAKIAEWEADAKPVVRYPCGHDNVEHARAGIKNYLSCPGIPDAPASIGTTPEPTPAQLDPRENGTLCDRCGERYKVDLMLPDEVWKRVVRRSNLLCGVCIVTALENLGFDAYQLEKIP